MFLRPNLKSFIYFKFINHKYTFLRCFCSETQYKVLFFGSDLIALSSLKKINEFRKAEPLIKKLDLVTANKSKNKSIIEKYAEQEGIKNRNWPLEDLQEQEYDIGLIVAFGHLIKDDVLNKFPLGMINVHPSLLPRWRGAAPIIHTLLHGDDVTGVSLMKIKPNVFDVGEIISQQVVPVSKDIKLPELTAQLSEIGADMLVECIRHLPHSLQRATPQSEDSVTYARKINKGISEVRWTEMDAIQVFNLHRAIFGLYDLTTKFRNKEMKLFDAFLENNQEISDKEPGSLEYCEKSNALKVVCKDRRYIYFKSVRIVGKRRISALDFYNGYIKNMPLEELRRLVLENK